ncbi:MAG: SPFH domain-containing protein [Bacteroidales bacterium]|jgi:regulator of protease activity HflC (stomatin/prohibitin superfamily)|nr:SPFH domain-containing protein [Bacteroidales bacterium]
MEKNIKPSLGYLALAISILMLLSPFLIFADPKSLLIITGTIVLSFLSIFGFIGLFVVNPNESMVLILFGKYMGTARENGFFWVNPFYVKKKISLRARNMESESLKVNDKMGNPIIISVVMVWRIRDTYKAAFEVDNYEIFVKTQTEAAVRKLAHTYPYDTFDDAQEEISLRGGGDEINAELEREISERLAIAGVEVLESRLSNLSYAPEIAGAMLQRQQATAIIAARTRIVEGAVSMVDMALNQLSKKGIVELDAERKAAMVGNLMVVLTSERAAQPIVNAGTLY